MRRLIRNAHGCDRRRIDRGIEPSTERPFVFAKVAALSAMSECVGGLNQGATEVDPQDVPAGDLRGISSTSLPSHPTESLRDVTRFSHRTDRPKWATAQAALSINRIDAGQQFGPRHPTYLNPRPHVLDREGEQGRPPRPTLLTISLSHHLTSHPLDIISSSHALIISASRRSNVAPLRHVAIEPPSRRQRPPFFHPP